MGTEHGPKTIQSVQRAMQILFSFSPEHPRWRVSELGEVLGLHPSTISRLLTTLKKMGIVRKDPLTGQYELGMRVLDLSNVVLSQLHLIEVATAFMSELVSRCRESVFLVILDGTDTVTVAQVAAPRLITPTRYSVSRRYQASAVSGGKLLLAHSPKSVVDQLIEKGLHAYTQHTVTSPQKLLAELEQVRQKDYAITNQELEIGLFAVAAPIRDHEGTVIAAVSVSGPPERLSSEHLPEFITGIRETAQQISTALGWRASK
jgi:IclR family KDG regulon transcriptional repressor